MLNLETLTLGMAIVALTTPTLADPAGTSTFFGASTAQPQPASQTTNGSYGVADTTTSVIPAVSFGALYSSTTYDSNDFTRCITNSPSGLPSLYAPIPDDIPNGALLTAMDGYFLDNDAGNDTSMQLGVFYSDIATGTLWSGTGLTSPTSTSGTPGPTKISTPLAITIDRTQDVNGDGNEDLVSYQVAVGLGASTDLCVRAISLTWQRQISPAPLTETFNDVPTTHQFFREIEALADSGITSGCGGGNYCPDAPLTRGQMAVFLAKALGLHWPN